MNDFEEKYYHKFKVELFDGKNKLENQYYSLVISKDHQIIQFLEEEYNKCEIPKKERKLLSLRIVFAQFHYVDNFYSNISLDDKLNIIISLIRKNIDLYIYAYQNLRATNNYIFEPQFASTFSLAKKITNDIKHNIRKNKYSKRDEYLYQAFINFFRAVRSSLMMFSVSDDIHGVAIYRGIVEFFIRFISINESNIEDYVRYVEFNKEVQEAKIYKRKYSSELKELINKHHLSASALESYLLYGWIKNKNGSSIRTFSEAVKLSNLREDIKAKYLSFYHLASEFVHEDYIDVDYNYIEIRKNSINFLAYISVSFIDEFVKRFTDTPNQVEIFGLVNRIKEVIL